MSTFYSDLLRAAPEPRVLVRFPNWVGDAVMALPALEALALSLPHGRVVVLAKPWVAGVAALSGSAHEVLIYMSPGEHDGIKGKISLASTLRGRFDGALLLQNAFEAALIAAAAGIPLRGGYNTDYRRLLLTHSVPCTDRKGGGRHQIRYYLELVKALGFDTDVDGVPSLKPQPYGGLEPGYAVLAPGASFGTAKMWPLQRYVDLGCRLAERGLKIVVAGSDAEVRTCRRVAEGIGECAIDLSGSTSLEEIAAILAFSDVSVCNDSGLMHLAAAAGAPLVALFGSTDPGSTGPVSDRAVVIRGGATCAPCFLRECPAGIECFDEVTVDAVMAACLRLMEGHAPAGNSI